MGTELLLGTRFLLEVIKTFRNHIMITVAQHYEHTKRKKKTSIGEDVEKLEHSHTAGRSENDAAAVEKESGSSS